jgi:hypothetical protein
MTSYDDKQVGAVLVTCAICRKPTWMVVPQPVCQACR